MTSGRSERLPVGFRRLIGAWGASLSGDGLRVVGLPLLAAQVDPSPVSVAAVAVATTLPWLLIAIPAGALVDRLDPARVVSVAHLVRALLTGGLVAALLTTNVGIPLLCVVGFGITAAETFADGAAQSLLVGTVPPHQWEQANSRFVTVETLALDLVGPLAAGVLFQIKAWLPFAVSAVCFLVGAFLVTGLHAERPVPGAMSTESPGPRESPWRRVGAGLARLWSDRVLRTLVLTVAVMAMANAAMDGVLVLYATGSLGLSEPLFPTLLAAYSVGTLLAAVLVGRWGRNYRNGPLMMAALAGIGGTMLLMGLFPVPAVAWSCFLVMGLAGGTWNVLSATRRQRRTPRDMVARVSSAFRVVAWGVIPIGAAAGGGIGKWAGIPMVFVVSGVTVLVLGLFVVRSFVAKPAGRHRSQPGPGPNPDDPVTELSASSDERAAELKGPEPT